MSVESAWEKELVAAGEAMGDDLQRHLDRNRELSAEVERLRAFVAKVANYSNDGWLAREAMDLNLNRGRELARDWHGGGLEIT